MTSDIAKLQILTTQVVRYFKADISKRTNKREIVYPRQLWCYVGAKRLGLSVYLLEENSIIDRTTILYALKTIDNLLSYDAVVQRHVMELEELCLEIIGMDQLR